jgi:molecular chaperone GrpE
MKRKQDLSSENRQENDDNSNLEQNQNDPITETQEIVDEKVAKLDADLQAANDKYLRLYSDFENYKRRISKERLEASKMIEADSIISILPIIDDLERAIKSNEDAKDIESVKEGVKLIYSKVKSLLGNKGLKEMDATGKVFDADLHDAIANIPATSEDMKGKVVEEIEKGYLLNDKVIRHAKVIVGN